MNSAKLLPLILAVLITTCLSSCGHHRRPNPPPGVEYTDVLGPLGITYHHYDGSVAAVTTEFRQECLRKLSIALDAYEEQHNWSVVPVEVWIYPFHTGAVPIGTPNGGGAYLSVENRILLDATCQAVFHEFNHLRLWAQNLPFWFNHDGPEWEKVWAWKAPK